MLTISPQAGTLFISVPSPDSRYKKVNDMAEAISNERSGVDPVSADGYRGVKHQAALRRFAIAITVLTIAGHSFLGFEQSYAQPIVAVITAYAFQLLFEWIYARGNGMRPKFYGSFSQLVDFLLPAHIAALAITMLMYFNDRLLVVVFAVAVAIASKSVLRVPTQNGSRHFFNPSNLALSVTFLLYPSVGLTMPWQWTTEISGIGDWLFPIFIFGAGSLLHIKYASRIWVVLSFLVAFIAQALLRSLITDVNLLTALVPATGVPAAIFTFYMAPDPATSPSGKLPQMMFGTSIAFVYMILVMLHIVYALFFALTLVCLGRGIYMLTDYALHFRRVAVSNFETRLAPAAQ